MPRQNNFYYQNPAADIGESLGRALFGDPKAHDALIKAQSEEALRNAQAGMATSHGALYDSQAADQTQRTAGSLELAAAINALRQPVAPPVVMPSDNLAPLPEPVAAPPIDFAGKLPGIIASLTQAQGGKVNMSDTMTAILGSLGGDTEGRRALVVGGHTPGPSFALTSDRADAISARDAAEGLTQATSVADINHANDIPIATMHDVTTRRGQDIGSADRQRGQDIGSSDRQRGQDIKGAGSSRSVRPISAGAYQMLFGVADDPDKPGELKTQMDGRDWAQTPDAGTLTRIKSAVIDRYRQSGNHVQAVSDVLDEAKARWDRKLGATARTPQPRVVRYDAQGNRQ